MENNKKTIILIIIIAGIIVIISINSILSNSAKEVKYSDLLEENTVSTEEERKVKKDTIKIHISGEVNYNGILELEEGARIDDAINAAGGSTPSADIDKINLAYLLEDGQKIYIPKIGEDENDIVTVSVGVKNKTAKININTAEELELESLPGIGPSMAKKIIEYRKENGKFNSIEEIKNVKGMGENKYEEIKEKIKIK